MSKLFDSITSADSKREVTYKAYDGEEFKITFKGNVGYSTIQQMVNNVVSGVFRDGNFYAGLIQPLKELMLIAAYTDIELPDDINDQLKLTDNRDFIGFIARNIEYNDWFLFDSAVSSAVEFEKMRYNVAMTGIYSLTEALKEYFEAEAAQAKAEAEHKQAEIEQMKNMSPEKLQDFLNSVDMSKLEQLKGIAAVWNEAEQTGDFSKLIRDDGIKSKKRKRL